MCRLGRQVQGDTTVMRRKERTQMEELSKEEVTY
jgi:hypothetical protein